MNAFEGNAGLLLVLVFALLQAACDRRPAPGNLESAAASGSAVPPAPVAALTASSSAAPSRDCEGCRYNLGVHLSAGCMRKRDSDGGYFGAIPTAMAIGDDSLQFCARSCCADELTRLCETGLPASCRDLGVLLTEGGRAPGNDARAAAILTEACDKNVFAACFELAVLLEEGRVVDKNLARAATLYAKACGSPLDDACFRLGAMVEEGRGVDAAEARAMALYASSCDRGHGPSCFKVGALFAKRPEIVNQGRAERAYARACKLGVREACAMSPPKRPTATSSQP